jgi:hypothetical protein
MGVASVSLARTFKNSSLNADSYLVGASQTRSSSSDVTDSAAGATAFSCTLRTHNEGVAVKPDDIACGTVLEAAKAKGDQTEAMRARFCFFFVFAELCRHSHRARCTDEHHGRVACCILIACVRSQVRRIHRSTTNRKRNSFDVRRSSRTHTHARTRKLTCARWP